MVIVDFSAIDHPHSTPNEHLHSAADPGTFGHSHPDPDENTHADGATDFQPYALTHTHPDEDAHAIQDSHGIEDTDLHSNPAHSHVCPGRQLLRLNHRARQWAWHIRPAMADHSEGRVGCWTRLERDRACR